VNIEDTKPIDALACRVWSGSHYHYPHIERMIADLARLRKLESEFHAAGFITDSGEVRKMCPKADGTPSELPVSADGFVVGKGAKLHPLHPIDLGNDDGDFATVEMVYFVVPPEGGRLAEDDEAEVGKCYSSQAAAQAARGEK
jgi:hypothetical protein